MPAWNAARVDPVHALSKGTYLAFSTAESRFRVVLGALFVLAFFFTPRSEAAS